MIGIGRPQAQQVSAGLGMARAGVAGQRGLAALVAHTGSRPMSASSAAVAPSSALDSGSRRAASREASSARCCSELRSAADSVGAENTSLASTRSRSVARPSRVTAVRRSAMVRPWLKKAEFDSCSTLAAIAGSAATSWRHRHCRRRRHVPGPGSGSGTGAAARAARYGRWHRAGAGCPALRAVLPGWSVPPAALPAPAARRKRWATPMRRAAPVAMLRIDQRDADGLQAQGPDLPSSVVALRSGNCGQTITASTPCVATAVIAAWPSVAVNGCQSSPRSAMNSVSSAGRLAASPTSRIRTTHSPGCLDDGCR